MVLGHFQHHNDPNYHHYRYHNHIFDVRKRNNLAIQAMPNFYDGRLPYPNVDIQAVLQLFTNY